MNLKNLASVKSTILGIVFIGLGMYLQIHNGVNDYFILGFFYVSGSMLLLAPDKYINQLERFITNKAGNKKVNDNDSSTGI